MFLDTVRARVAGRAEKRDALQRKCAAHQLPWEPHLFTEVGANAMHLATLYMSRCGAHHCSSLLFIVVFLKYFSNKLTCVKRVLGDAMHLAHAW